MESTLPLARDKDGPGDLAAEVPGLRRMAAALLRDPRDADDLAQEAALAALERPPARPGPLGAWLRGTLRNLARMRVRAEARRRRREERAARREAVEEDPADSLERMEALRRLLAALERLDPRLRAVLLLRFREDLGPTAIAARLGIPRETARTRLRRALEALREDLGAGRDSRTRRGLLLLSGHPPDSPVGGAALPGALPSALLGAAAMTVGAKAAAGSAILLVLLGAFLLRGGGSPPVEGGPSGPRAEPAATAGPAAASLPRRGPAPPAEAPPSPAAEEGPPPPATSRTLLLRILDPEGNPSAYASLAHLDAGFAILRHLDADADGRASLEAAPSTFLRVVPSGPGAPLLLDLDRVETRAGQPAEIRLAEGLALEGRVLGSRGIPAAVPLVLRPLDPPAWLRGAGSPRVESGRDGAFRAAGLLPLRYRIEPALDRLEGGHPGRPPAPPVEARPGDGEVVIRLRDTAVLRLIPRDRATGEALSLGDAPLRVEVLLDGAPRLLPPVIAGRHASLEDDPGTRVVVRVLAEGYRPSEAMEATFPGPGEVLVLPVELDRDPEGLVPVTLRLVDDRDRRIERVDWGRLFEGPVLDGEGRAPWARRVSPDGRSTWVDHPGTAAAGGLLHLRLPPGSHLLSLWARVDPALGTSYPGVEVRVEVRAGEPQDRTVVFRTGGKVAIRSAPGLRGEWILRSPEGEEHARGRVAGEEEEEQVFLALLPGTWTVLWRPDGGMAMEGSVVVEADRRAEFHLGLGQGR